MKMVDVWASQGTSQIHPSRTMSSKMRYNLMCLLLLSTPIVLSTPVQPDHAVANLPLDPWVELKFNVFQLSKTPRQKDSAPAWVDLEKRQDAFATASSIGSTTTAASNPSTTTGDRQIPTTASPSSSSASSFTNSSSSSTISSNGTRTSSGPSGILTASSGSGPTTIPTAFDGSIGSNFTTQSCPNFFLSFVKDPNLLNCIPVSLLLLNSNGFFNTEESIASLTPVLDKSCQVDFNACRDLLQGLAYQLRQPSNCGADFQLFNPLVTQAFDGFVAYEPVYRASCLKSSSGSFCFADAVTNRSATVDSYPYYLPLGVTLSGRPDCTDCLNQTMAIYNGFAGNGSIPLSKTYKQAAQQINLGCGPNFASTTVQTVASAATLLSAQFTITALLSVMGALFSLA